MPAQPPLSTHQVLFTFLVKEPQNLPFSLLNLRAPTPSGPKAGEASPSLSHPEFGSGTPPLPEPGILNTLQREGIFSGFYTCLQTLGAWLQCRDEMAGPRSWPIGVCGDFCPSDALTFLPWSWAAPPGRGGAAELNLGHCFLPIPLFAEYRRLSCLSSTYFSFFYICHPFCAASPPKRPCSVVEKAPEGSQEDRVAMGSVPSSPRGSVTLSQPRARVGASVSTLVK